MYLWYTRSAEPVAKQVGAQSAKSKTARDLIFLICPQEPAVATNDRGRRIAHQKTFSKTDKDEGHRHIEE